jgi:mono/diheme cytochrome c family protein
MAGALIMKANKHLLLWSSIGTLLVLLWAAFHENYLQDWRRVQRKIRSAMPPDQAASFQIQLRQIVAPATKASDRCVSCHVGMAPGESGIAGDPLYGAHKNVVHDPADFGCTVCHGGQGRATTISDAHGQVPHWPEPMLPRKYLYAGCGSCHTHLSVPNMEKFNRGRLLVEQNDCFACHRIDGRGGTLRPGGAGGEEGPDLSNVGLHGFRADWYEDHLDRNRKAETEAWKSAFGPIESQDRDAIEEYLNSRVGAPGLIEGKALFHSLGCRGCHKVGGVGGDDGPDLTRVGQKDPAVTPYANLMGPHTLENWLKEHFQNPARVVPGSQMPILGLNQQQIDELTFYLFSLRRGKYPEALWPKDRIRAERFGVREFATDGATIYGTFCAACHGPSGEGMRYPGMPPFPAIGNPDFLRIASNEFISGTVRRGRPGRRMPAWGEKEGGLHPEEIQAVVGYLRQSTGVEFQGDSQPARWAKGDVVYGKQLFAQNCSLCHGDKGEGKEGPALNNRVFLELATDTYLLETIRAGRRGTNMNGFGEGSSVRETLSRSDMESIIVFLRSWQ